MRQVSQSIIHQFNSASNSKYLKQTLDRQYPDNNINFPVAMSHFSGRITEELYMSDPVGSIPYQVKCYNEAFIEDCAQFIETTLAPRVLAYTVNDGQPMSRYNQDMDTWARNPAPGQVLRDDTQAARENTYNALTGSCKYAPPEESGAGFTFCDQAHLNTSYHVEAFNTPWMQAMNRDVDPNDAGFGNRWGDEKLLSRRTFRDGNRIPYYQKWLTGRHYERDIDEALSGGGERGFINNGFDQQGLINRKKIMDEQQAPARPIPNPNMATNARWY